MICGSSAVVFSCSIVFFFKQKTAYEMRISDWSSDVCSSDLFGSALNRSWREPGWVVMGMTLDRFDALSRKYGQLGTLWWTYGQAGRLRVDAGRPAEFGDDEHIDWLRTEPAAH